MRDFEVLTLKDNKYVMQVNGKWYEVPHKWRRLNTVKLAGAFGRGEPFAEFKGAEPPNKAPEPRPTLGIKRPA